uniref:Uncharacterized protein n=2 Tax=Listeria seeligeri TaxID=1640 RepID=A0A7T0Q928_LISSE|nr:hypothetical protein pLIS400301c [Listeria seeligeri]
MFNIYYLNYNKAFEIVMLIDNKLVDSTTNESSETNHDKSNKNLEGSVKIPIIGRIGAMLSATIVKENETVIDSKIVENIQIIQSKSTVLKGIIDEIPSSNKQPFNAGDEGNLVNIKVSSLLLRNEDDVRAAKVVKPGIVTEAEGFQVDGMKLNADSLMNSMLNDYFYLLSGETKDEIQVLFKIPLNEQFESNYSIDDILIGNVSVIGINKGGISEEKLSNTYTYMSNLGKKVTKDSESQITPSTKVELEEKNGSGDNTGYHFIDVIAIVQNITINSGEHNE